MELSTFRAFATNCIDAQGHLRKARVLLETCPPEVFDLHRDRIINEIDAIGQAIGVSTKQRGSR